MPVLAVNVSGHRAGRGRAMLSSVTGMEGRLAEREEPVPERLRTNQRLPIQARGQRYFSNLYLRNWS